MIKLKIKENNDIKPDDFSLTTDNVDSICEMMLSNSWEDIKLGIGILDNAKPDPNYMAILGKLLQTKTWCLETEFYGEIYSAKSTSYKWQILQVQDVVTNSKKIKNIQTKNHYLVKY